MPLRPGERTTIKAKLRGLSQVASYISGRYGATRPRAHVAPESCLASGCHGDKKFMDKPLEVGTVTFVHAKHLQHTDQDEKPSQDRLETLTKQLQEQLGDDHLAELTATAKEIGPAEEQTDALQRLCQQWNAKVDRPVLAEFLQLVHRPVRIAQLHSLQCVDCHANTLQGLGFSFDQQPESFPGAKDQLLHLPLQQPGVQYRDGHLHGVPHASPEGNHRPREAR